MAKMSIPADPAICLTIIEAMSRGESDPDIAGHIAETTPLLREEAVRIVSEVRSMFMPPRPSCDPSALRDALRSEVASRLAPPARQVPHLPPWAKQRRRR